MRYNTLYQGNCLGFLKGFPGESVDLVYIDPPFFSQRTYRVGDVGFDDKFESMDHYIDFMTERVRELHRVLKPTGSVYLHCDQTASHYLKVMCDKIFGKANFRNEIVWKRKFGSNATNKPSMFSTSTDSILFYTKSKDYNFNQEYLPYSKGQLKVYNRDDKDGKGAYLLKELSAPSDSPTLKYDFLGYKTPEKGWRWTKKRMFEAKEKGLLYLPEDKNKRPSYKSYLKDKKGIAITNLWADISQVGGSAKERLGYPTQKPIALLERIIKASTNEGDVVLDAFCGSGTTLHAAHNLNRRWVGIDQNPDAIKICQERLGRVMSEK